MIAIYLILLIIAPQDWLAPFVGLPVDYILYPAWMVALVISGRTDRLTRLTPQDRIVLAFVAWVFVSAIANYASGIDGRQLYMYAKWFVLYKMVSASLANMSHVRRASTFIVLLAAVLVAESIQQMHSPGHIGWAGQTLGWVDQSAREAGVPGRTRWVSIFDGPGVFCVLFTLAVPFLLQRVGRASALLWRLTAAMLLLPFGLAIYYTGSRGGFLATLGVIAMHYAVRVRLSMTKIVAVVLVLAAIFAFAPAYMTQIYDENRSAQHRVDMWIQGLEMVRYYPVFGVGRGHFLDYTRRYLAHNSAVEIAGEMGLPGIFLWTAMLFMAFKTLMIYVQRSGDPGDRSHAVALGIALAGYIISAMFVTLEYETLYFLLGMSAAVGSQLDPLPRFSRRDALVVGILVAGFLCTMKLFTVAYY